MNASSTPDDCKPGIYRWRRVPAKDTRVHSDLVWLKKAKAPGDKVLVRKLSDGATCMARAKELAGPFDEDGSALVQT